MKARCLVPRAPCGTGREKRSRWGGVGACLSTETSAPDNPVPPRKGFFVLFGLQKGRSRSGSGSAGTNPDPRYEHSGMTASLGLIHHIALKSNGLPSPIARGLYLNTPKPKHPTRGRRESQMPRPACSMRDGPRETQPKGWGEGMPIDRNDCTRQPRSPVQKAFLSFLAFKKDDLALALALPERTQIPDTSTRG